MKTTRYFDHLRARPDRSHIKESWIQSAVSSPEHEEMQKDGRIRRWRKISEAGDKYLRVVLLADGATVHNAFFDRSFKGGRK